MTDLEFKTTINGKSVWVYATVFPGDPGGCFGAPEPSFIETVLVEDAGEQDITLDADMNAVEADIWAEMCRRADELAAADNGFLCGAW
jgi:hypothetical protein